MNAEDWKIFIQGWSKQISTHDFGHLAEYTRTFDPVHGYGSPGASEEILKTAEARLGVVLPPTYREFLKATNGLKQPFEQMAATGGDFCQAEEIDWFRVGYSDWIEIWSENSWEVSDEDYLAYGHAQNCGNFRPEYLKTALALSQDGDAGIYLLIPEVHDKAGEWEAWHLASWIPGANRYQSFEEMMRERHRSFEKHFSATTCFGF